MAPFLIGSSFWLLALAVLVRLVPSSSPTPSSKPGTFFWIGCFIIASILVFRPHEDIFGGNDPGVYLNSAASFAQHGSLTFTDPLLAQVPEGKQDDFFYAHGHPGFYRGGWTKDAALWVYDQHEAVVGPRLYIGYPLAMSVPIVLGSSWLALYVTPLFGLFMALAVRALASQLVRRPWSGELAMFFYLLTPVIIWNIRSPRPEIPAAFFLIAGWSLLLRVWLDRDNPRWLDATLAALCIAASPFFHPSAWFGAAAAALVVTALILRGQRSLLLYPLFAWVGLWIYVYHTQIYLTPINAPFTIFSNNPVLWNAAFFSGFILLATVCLSSRIRGTLKRFAMGMELPSRLRQTLQISIALTTTAIFVFIYMNRDAGGHVPGISEIIGFVGNHVPLLDPTRIIDLEGLRHLLSRPVMFAALAGFLVLILRRDEFALHRNVFLLLWLPGILLTGVLNVYMFETRRLMIYFAPVLAICLSALCTVLTDRKHAAWRFIPMFGMAAALLFFSHNSRAHLTTLTEYKGFYGFLESVAQPIASHNGILLAEYSRTAAPLEHFFGVPLLSLDTDRRTDYTQAEETWSEIMAAGPERKAFFLTPFQTPRSDRFDFVHVQTFSYRGSNLAGSRVPIPREIRPWQLTLNLYLMEHRGDSPEYEKPLTPHLIRFDQGNMGLRNFSRSRVRQWDVQGVALKTDQMIPIAWDPASDNDAVEHLHLFFYSKAERHVPPSLTLEADSRFVSLEWLEPIDGWWLARVAGRNLSPSQPALTLTAEEELLFHGFHVVTKEEVLHFTGSALPGATSHPMAAFRARWARDGSRILLPLQPKKATSEALVFLNESSGNKRLFHFGFNADHGRTVTLPESEWAWWTLKLQKPKAEQDQAWLTISTPVPWNSQAHGYPEDLSALMGYVVVPAVNSMHDLPRTNFQ